MFKIWPSVFCVCIKKCIYHHCVAFKCELLTLCLGVLISSQDGELVVIFKNNGREYEEKPRIHY